jgi:endonuclease YncB( thermonuclease family)
MSDSTLLSLRSADVPLFGLTGETVRARVVDVYDGDTFTAVFCLPGVQIATKMKCRLNGLDTPELHPPLGGEHSRRAEAIQRALAARARLCELVTDCPSPFAPGRLGDRVDSENRRIVDLECHGLDKYGRLLVTVRAGADVGVINEVLVREGHAVPYSGGTKPRRE